MVTLAERPVIVSMRSVCALTLIGLTAATGCERAEDRFPAARALVTRGAYEEAIPDLRQYLKDNPQGKNASRARLFLGKAYMGLGRLDQARIAFAETIEKHPGSLEAHKSRYKLAVIDLLEDKEVEAARRFERLAQQPDGPLAPEATAMAAHLRARAGDGLIESEAPN